MTSALRLLARLVRAAVPAPTRERRREAGRPAPGRRGSSVPAPARPQHGAHDGAYPGDFDGRLTPVYAPDPDGRPDPGEIVWAWVPFEEDHARGKDRPVLLVGRDGPWLLGLMLSSRDHDERPGRPGERWLDLGAGDWDARRRPSEVRLDRVVRLGADAVRREGAVLDAARFDQVVRALAR